MSIPNEKYEYWGFYLLKGTKLEIKNCAYGNHTFDVYIIQGKKNFDAWKRDSYDTSSYKEYYLTFHCPGFFNFYVSETDEYYIVYVNHGSEASITATFSLNRTVYDTSDSVAWCKNVRYCDLSYSGKGSDESVVIFVKSAQNEEGDATLNTDCKHRVCVFVLVFFLVPLCVGGWFSDNFNFCCIICLYFEISIFKIYPVYTSLFMYNFLIWKPTTHNVEYLIHFCANLIMKCHYRHTPVFTFKK